MSQGDNARSRILAVCLSLSALLASAPASASPGRGVYVNGQVHRVWVSGTIKHVAGNPTSSTNWVFVRAGDVHDSGWGVSTQMIAGTNLAVFDNKIFFPYTTFENGSFSTMGAYVATFDLTTNKWTTRKKLGSAHADNPSKGAGSGAAAVVFDNKLYVFTDTGTYTSADGVNWNSYGRMVNDSRYQPLDAITYYLPDAQPRILVIYGRINAVQNIWDQLYLATWNGTIGTGSDFPSSPALLWNVAVYGDVSLQLGTMDAVMNSPAGPKSLSAQLFAECPTSSGPAEIRHAALTISSSGVAGTQSHTYQDGDNMGSLWTYAWYTDLCDTGYTPPHQARRQTLVVHYSTGSDKAIAGPSDFLVPPKPTHTSSDMPSSQCGQWGGSFTDTNDEDDPSNAETYRKYWSLYGVVLGSPPFAINEIEDDYGIEQLSNVDYGQTNGTQIQHTQEWENIGTFSAGLQIRGGLGHFLEFENQTDISYSRALKSEKETTSTVTTGWSFTLGTEAQKTLRGDDLGRFGWGIFGVPKVIVQDFSVWAYDYDNKTQTGTALDQDVHLVEISPTSITVKPVAFELENPGGPNDDYPGLMSGMKAFGKSTDLDFWHAQSWETTTDPWTVKFGDATFGEPAVNALTFTTGATSTSSISDESETMTSTGETTDVELSDGASMNVGTKLKGFKVDLEAGYSSSFMTQVANTTSFGTELSLELKMAPCPSPAGADCVTKLTDQAYLLVPIPVEAGQEPASWLPTAYASQLPWAITWRTTSFAKVGGTESGLSAPPMAGSGYVVGGQGGSASIGESPSSEYALRGADLKWLDPKGRPVPVPMTASDFLPARGIEVELNGLSWSSREAGGTWTRVGDTWSYQPRSTERWNKVWVTLDFGSRTWDFAIANADLSGRVGADTGALQLTLRLNGKYSLKSDLRHEVLASWKWSGAAKDPRAIEVTSYEGLYDSASQTGQVSLEGTIPVPLATFGDMSFVVNGHAVHVPLLDDEGLEVARQSGGQVTYDRNGARVVVDFGKRKWSAVFGTGTFHRLMAPLRGAATVRIRVGGESWGSTDVRIANYASKLRLVR